MAPADYEIVVVDDASSDRSIEDLRRRFPWVRVHQHRRRQGTSRTKDAAIRRSRGEVVVYLDAHCRPEPFAILRLVQDVLELQGQAIVTPKVVVLDCDRWTNRPSQAGCGFEIGLDTLDGGWLSARRLRRHGRFLESPALIGCAFALSRDLYKRLRGFDRDMFEWGVEDTDFGLKAWLLGYPVLNDPFAVVGHRFRSTFDNYSVQPAAILTNKLRMARKNFTDPVWEEWLRRFRSRHAEEPTLDEAWTGFVKRRRSVERERRYLFARRRRDEFSYARYFGLDWPAE
jgi:GT2 family glycosyltransferase